MVLQFCTEQKQIDFEWNYGGHNNKRKYLSRIKATSFFLVWRGNTHFTSLNDKNEEIVKE